jgi:hypothetical protein
VYAASHPSLQRCGNKFTYFDKQELDNWAKSRRIATSAEIEQEAVARLVTGKLSKK